MPLGARWYYLTESIRHVIPSDYGNYEQTPQNPICGLYLYFPRYAPSVEFSETC